MLTANNTTFLLGAGASVDAGVPASFALTQKIVEAIAPAEFSLRRAPAQALNLALGAIIAHDAARGLPVFQGVDVERLFSAVQMLAERDSLEIAPFVRNWDPALDALGTRRLPSFFSKDFNAAIGSQYPSRLEKVFKAGVEGLVFPEDLGRVFTTLEGEMIDALRTCLRVEPGASDYLQPIFKVEGGPVRVATLNYDHGLEMAAFRAGLTVATGITLWDGELEWDWEAGADVNLLKLHGSLDWYYSDDHRGWGTFAEKTIVPFQPFEGGARSMLTEMAVVFGQRGKLRSDGPFLGMLSGFGHWLRDTQNLVIVGYSFRDDHINELIRRWLNRTERASLTIINPSMTEDVTRRWGQEGFMGEVVRAISTLRDDRMEILSQHSVIAAGARDGLAQILGRADAAP